MPHISMYSASAPTFRRMLRNAKTWIEKAEVFAQAKAFDVNTLMNARLAPDMFPFSRQVQIATDHAKNGLARLAMVDAPKFEDTEKTIAELKARIDRAVGFIDTIQPAQLDGSDAREIAFKGGAGERRFPSGENYLNSYALPNFYFHVTTAYAILRHNGVDVGKSDYLTGAKD